jgi:hypothetical protein
MWTGLVLLRIGTGGELVEFGIDPSDSMKCWETIEWPNISGLSSSAQLHRVSFVISVYSDVPLKVISVQHK